MAKVETIWRSQQVDAHIKHFQTDVLDFYVLWVGADRIAKFASQLAAYSYFQKEFAP